VSEGSNDDLTHKQRAFVEHYLACNFNATEAAKRAGYSEKTAYSQGQRLLKNVEVTAIVSQRLAEAAMTADEALARLSDMAKGDMSEFITVRREVYRESLPVTREAGIRRLGMKVANARWTLENAPLSPEETDVLEGRIGLWQQQINKWQEENAPDVVYLEGEGPERERTITELDVEKAKAAGKLHLIRKYRMGKDGLSFELYDAQGALVDILKIHGRYIDRKDLTSGGQPLKAYVGIDVDEV